MTKHPAWPEIDETVLQERMELLGRMRSQLDSVMLAWAHEKKNVFNANAWFGAAATAAEAAVDTRVTSMIEMRTDADAAYNFFIRAYTSVTDAKNEVTAVTNAAQDAINNLDSNDKDYSLYSDAIVLKTFNANVNLVNRAVNSIASVKLIADKNPQRTKSAPGEILDEGKPSTPPQTMESAPVTSVGLGPAKSETAVTRTSSTSSHETPPSSPPTGPAKNETAVTQTSSASSDRTPPWSQPTGPIKNETAVAQTSSSTPRTADRVPVGVLQADYGQPPISPTISSPVVRSGTLGPPPSLFNQGGSSPAAPSAVPSPDIARVAGGGNEQVPASLASQQPPLAHDVAPAAPGVQQPHLSPAAAHGAAAPTPAPLEPAAAVPAAPNQGSGGGGPSIPSGGGHASSVGEAAPSYSSGGGSAPPMPLGPPATPPPSGPVSGGVGSAQPGGPAVNPMSTNNSGVAGAAPAPVPVSPTRLERDTIAASSAGAGAATRRRGIANDPLTLARRIGAALNFGQKDFGFFWVTGLCADGSIVVANSYGLGYIPDGIDLPSQVHLATADEAIPSAERAKWATYPILAVQGWAHARELKLRAVIATDEQFASFDPGAAKIVITPEDIPDDGTMQGRTRLEVLAPGAAERLAAVDDAALGELLPPASAGIEAPTDDTASLWFNVAKPLMSTMPDRGLAHLRAMVIYADHAQELALHRAHTATDGAAQRAAIADWVYWQHIGVLTSDALQADVTV